MLPEPPVPQRKAGLRALKALIKHGYILSAFQALHEEMGDVFRLSLPGFKPVVLVGPEAAHYVLVTARGDLRWRPEGDPVTKLLRRGVLVQDGEEHDMLRRLMNPALHRRRLPGYVEAMWRYTDQVSATWHPSTPVDMLVEMRRIALLILMGTLFKVDFATDMARLWPAILRILNYISPSFWLVWRGVPRPGYRDAQQQIDDYLYRVVRARRAAIGEADDLLGLLVTTPKMGDDLIRDQLLTMLIAGHDTSTALLAWALYLLGSYPAVMARAQAEVDGVLGDDVPDFAHLERLVYLERVIKETLRLYPPIHIGNRTAAVDLEFQGYRIPAGTRVVYSIYLTHRHPRHWPEPEHFDPDRFTPDQNRVRRPYIYLPFGGGPRNCIGAAFAEVEAKVILARILQTFDLRLVHPKVRPHMGATLEPRPGVIMLAQRRRKGDPLWRLGRS